MSRNENILQVFDNKVENQWEEQYTFDFLRDYGFEIMEG